MLASPLLLGICLVTMLAQGPDQGWSTVLLPVHVRDSLGGAAALGLVEGLFSAGALAGALIYGAVGHRFRRWPVYVVAFLIVGTPRFVVAALTGTVAPLAVMIAPLGGLAAGFLAGTAGLTAALLAAGGGYLLVTLGPVIFPAWKQLDRDRTGRQPASRSSSETAADTCS